MCGERRFTDQADSLLRALPPVYAFASPSRAKLGKSLRCRRSFRPMQQLLTRACIAFQAGWSCPSSTSSREPDYQLYFRRSSTAVTSAATQPAHENFRDSRSANRLSPRDDEIACCQQARSAAAECHALGFGATVDIEENRGSPIHTFDITLRPIGAPSSDRQPLSNLNPRRRLAQHLEQ